MYFAKSMAVCRAIVCLLFVSLVSGALPVVANTEFQGSMSLSADSNSIAQGESVSVTVWIDENPGIASFILNVEFDRTRLQADMSAPVRRAPIVRDRALRSLTAILPSMAAAGQGNLRSLWYGANNDTSYGNLLILGFTALPYAPPGDAYVRVSVDRGNSNRIIPGGTVRVDFPEARETIAVTGDATPIAITVNAENGGSASGGGRFGFGDTVQLTASPNNGYEFAGWYDDNTQINANAAFSFEAEASRTLTARFRALGADVPPVTPPVTPPPTIPDEDDEEDEDDNNGENGNNDNEDTNIPDEDEDDDDNGEENGDDTVPPADDEEDEAEADMPDGRTTLPTPQVWHPEVPEIVNTADLSEELQELIEDDYVFMVDSYPSERVLMFMPVAHTGATPVEALVPHLVREGEELSVVIPSFFDAGQSEMRLIGYTGELYMVRPNLVTFTDVQSGAWYHSAVTFVAARELFAGVGSGLYGPASHMTRAMFLTVLSRLDDINPANYVASPFADVNIGAWYGSAIAWANAEGIINSEMISAASEFNPNNNITREEMAVIFANYLAIRDFPLVHLDVPAFDDLHEANPWARVAIQEMRQHAIISGVGGNLYNPQYFATRAEVAQIFTNLVQAIVGLS